jgi:hypothetical protein
MSADNRDPFALARQGEDDAELFAAEREYAELQPRWTLLANLRFDHPAVEALNAEESRLAERINAIAATTAAGAAVKLRYLVEQSPMCRGFGPDDGDLDSIRQVIAFLEAQR